MTPVWGTIASVRRELEDTVTLTIDPAGGDLIFAPGQFTMLYAFGIGEVPISISGDPAHPELLVQTIRRAGAVTSALCDLMPGDSIGVRGPFGNPWPVVEAEGGDTVFVAGGIGLAPLRPAIYAVLANRAKYSDVVLLYGARSPQELLYAQELREWGARFDMTVLVTVDRGERAWTGSVGVVTKLVRRGPYDPDETTAFVCGPEIMMRFSAAELLNRGIGRNHVYLSMERNMKCGFGSCGHCQMGRRFVCSDGPVFTLNEAARYLRRLER
jgi:NAD(P)H-flavin reductase